MEACAGCAACSKEAGEPTGPCSDDATAVAVNGQPTKGVADRWLSGTVWRFMSMPVRC